MKIYIVVVLYNCLLKDSHTVNSLFAMNLDKSALGHTVNVLLYDNGTMNNKNLYEDYSHFNYVLAKENLGLPGAYNYALQKANDCAADWLLLLDQDTKLPADYLEKLCKLVNPFCDSVNLVAAVPKMCYQNILFSPSKVLYAGMMRPVENDFLGIYPKEIFAIGSCSLLKVKFLLEIGGFSEDYWLDSLDRWLYKQIQLHKRDVLISDIIVEHELSVMDYDKFVSESRYKNILNYETKFMENHCSNFENFVFKIRLFLRSIKLFCTTKNKNFGLITAKHIFYSSPKI